MRRISVNVAAESDGHHGFVDDLGQRIRVITPVGSSNQIGWSRSSAMATRGRISRRHGARAVENPFGAGPAHTLHVRHASPYAIDVFLQRDHRVALERGDGEGRNPCRLARSSGAAADASSVPSSWASSRALNRTGPPRNW